MKNKLDTALEEKMKERIAEVFKQIPAHAKVLEILEKFKSSEWIDERLVKAELKADFKEMIGDEE